MTVLVESMSNGGMIVERGHRSLKADIYCDLASVESLWRDLESAPNAVLTPYQRFDWVEAYVNGLQLRDSLRIIVLRASCGRPLALLPLAVSRRRGLSVACVIGAKHANYHLPLYTSRQAVVLATEDLQAALVSAGREAGIDAYFLDHQPRFWDGIANPLSAKGIPCASDAYGLMLGPNADATVKRAFSSDSRKKLRAKERKLVEAHGPVEYRSAKTREAISTILAAFYEQKRTRFASMGIKNPYAYDDVRHFISGATDASATTPAIEVHALVAKNTGRIFATFGGAVSSTRFSGMWTSFDPDPDIARFSPGDLLLYHLIGQQTQTGRRALDLGVGEARYKSSICDETIELVEVRLAVSVRGHVYAAMANMAARMKRRIKRSPRLWSIATRLRRLRPA